MNHPKMSSVIVYIVMTVATWSLAFLIGTIGESSAGKSAAVIGLAAIGFGFFVGFAITLGNTIWYIVNERLMERKLRDSITPALELARVVATMRPDQTQLFPHARYGADIGVAATENGPKYFLKTPFMDIDLVWLDYYVNELCSRVDLYPVSRFASESMEQRMAQAFTAWVTQDHLFLAYPANGPKPAQWMTPGAKQRCVEMIWGRGEEEEEDAVHG